MVICQEKGKYFYYLEEIFIFAAGRAFFGGLGLVGLVGRVGGLLEKFLITN